MEKNNLLLDCDSYKASHFLQFPPKTTGMFSYLESRGGRFANTLFFGNQMILHRVAKGFSKEDLEEAIDFFSRHGEPFPKEGFEHMLNKHGGNFPIRIRSVAEGSVIPTHNVLMTCESTDPKVFWIVSYLETMLMRAWYPITVATQSYHIRQIIRYFLERTADNWRDSIWFKLHDFGSRGVSSPESAGIGGAAHLVSFQGSDTVNGVRYANHYYKPASKMAAFSIPAAEHSTITAWGKEHEVDAYRNMLKQFAKPGSLVAVVSDSYDIWNAVEHIWGETLRQEIENSGATVVIRPDSGNPVEVVLRVCQLLEQKFGVTYNSKAFKMLNNVRVIQGDGVDETSIREILEAVTRAGFSADNVAFGMGGALLQKVNRDTQKFAYKCSEVTIDGRAVPVSKNPITDPGKRSKAGRLDLRNWNGKIETVQGDAFGSLLVPTFENGKILREYTLDEVRDRAHQLEEINVTGRQR